MALLGGTAVGVHEQQPERIQRSTTRRLDVFISLNAATDGIWIPTRSATIFFSASVGFNKSIQMIWLGPSWPLENAPSLSRYTLSMFNPIPLPGQVYLLERPLMFASRDLQE